MTHHVTWRRLGAAALALAFAQPAAAGQTWTGRASFYGAESGRVTASGAPFRPMGLTLAHRTLPFGTRVQVCFRACAIGTVNDRGPYIPGRDFDLARGLARAVGLEPVGVGTIRVTLLP